MARLYLLLAALVAAASAQNTPLANPNCVNAFDPNAKYFKYETKVDTASLFSIQYFNNYKLVSNKYSNQTFALVQCGTPRPASIPANMTVFEIPVSRVATLETTATAFLDYLGVVDTIVAFDTESAVTSPCLQKKREQGSARAIPSNITETNLLLSNVDVVFGGSFFPKDMNLTKAVYTSEVQDPGPLNRAEWLEFFSLFYNLEETAEKKTRDINNNYNCFKNGAAKAKSKPLVAWTSYLAPSEFNNNTASWSISTAAYKKQLTEDASALFHAPTTFNFNSSAAFLEAMKEVDVMIDETFIARTMDDVLKNYGISDAGAYKFTKSQQVYRLDGIQSTGGGFDWFATPVVQADATLEALIYALHPEMKNGKSTRWFRNVANDPISESTPGSCSDVKAAATSLASNCQSLTFTTSAASSPATATALTVFSAVLAAVTALFA
ncbi:uncharacterized protein VTP21DRAFT_8793 [Calcarisporiella thermophila]|uniref:uncharacterized protein n=1 Tax=Calcarisporiella thermophila TaxID=911321 RepID=UPI003742E963